MNLNGLTVTQAPDWMDTQPFTSARIVAQGIVVQSYAHPNHTPGPIDHPIHACLAEYGDVTMYQPDTDPDGTAIMKAYQDALQAHPDRTYLIDVRGKRRQGYASLYDAKLVKEKHIPVLFNRPRLPQQHDRFVLPSITIGFVVFPPSPTIDRMFGLNEPYGGKVCGVTSDRILVDGKPVAAILYASDTVLYHCDVERYIKATWPDRVFTDLPGPPRIEEGPPRIDSETVDDLQTLAIKVIQRLDEVALAAQLLVGDGDAVTRADALGLLGMDRAHADTILDPAPREALAGLASMNSRIHPGDIFPCDECEL